MQKQIYVLDGTKFSTLQEFAEYFSRTILKDHEWRGNFNAFNDVLRGGFGTPIGGFIIRWENSTLSREQLGYAQTAKWWEEVIANCHPFNIPGFQQQLARIKQGQGQTLFDTIVEIIREHGPGGSEAEDGVELLLL